MKKNIGFVPMDSSLAAWLLEKLTKEPPVSDCAEDLRSGIRDMLSGTTQALPPEVEPYITPETAATEAEEGWSCALTQSLYTGDKLLITVTVSGGD